VANDVLGGGKVAGPLSAIGQSGMVERRAGIGVNIGFAPV
jgi:hypothetical protein